MSINSGDEFFAAVAKLPLLTAGQLSVLKSLRDSLPDAKAVARECITRNWLTVYQANQLLQGKGRDLSLGSYVLQERLGEGGMGQVFKAMHRNLGRVSALKVIHKERLDSPNAVKRFQREVRAAAALHHVNIVLAYDADEIDGRHLLVMEYIEGARDLSQLVKQNGPLPVAQACDYIRQAALGLQHAHEKGMVHRDIKPANLLVTQGGKVVKVLDMGLALTLQDSGAEDDAGSTMTKTGIIMGTPDYLAPEQAMDSHTVDIRADIYSLGCTLYFLISGSVPFPGGSVMQKLLKHKLEEPKPLEVVRPELAPAVAAIVRKLMAKNPAERYQTPGEAAQALAAVLFDTTASATAATIALDPKAVAGTPLETGSFTAAIGYMSKRSDTVALEPVAARKSPQRTMLLLGLAGASLLALAVVGLTIWLTGRLALFNSKPTPIAIAPPLPPKPLVTVPPPNQAAIVDPKQLLQQGKWHYIGPFDCPDVQTGYQPVELVPLLTAML